MSAGVSTGANLASGTLSSVSPASAGSATSARPSANSTACTFSNSIVKDCHDRVTVMVLPSMVASFCSKLVRSIVLLPPPPSTVNAVPCRMVPNEIVSSC